MDAVPLGGRLPMAPLPPSQSLGFGTSRWRLQGNATLGLRAGGRGHHLFFLPHKSPLLALSGHGAMVCRLSAFGAKRTRWARFPQACIGFGRPTPASSAQSQHFTWLVIPGSARGGQNRPHDLLDTFLHTLKFPARQIELSPCSRDLGVGSDGRYMSQVYMNRFAAWFGQSDPNPRSVRDTITTEGGALRDAEL